MRIRRRGYTLIEMMIVVTLIAIVTATAMPHIDYQSFRQDASARAIRSAMQGAQAYAVSSQHNVFVAIDQPHNVLYIVYDYNDNLQWDQVNGEHVIAVPLQDGAQIASPPAALPTTNSPTAGIGIGMTTPATVAVAGKTTSTLGYVYRADGAVSTDVQIYINSKRGLAKDWRAISIIPATGRVDWYKYVNSTWQTAGI
jgi:prepilin-type N-terminal cleavage/methylation domain-containing protein